MKFWSKAERVMNYKAKTIADARKKEVMDKHLSFLVDQTQRYSSMLAQRLKAGACLCPLSFGFPTLVGIGFVRSGGHLLLHISGGQR